MQELIHFIEKFNKDYFIDTLGRESKIQYSKLQEQCLVENIFTKFAPEETDDFMQSFFNHFSINSENYIHGLHFKDLAQGILIPVTLITKPILGYKKWMVVSDKRKYKLSLDDLCRAIKNKELNSLRLLTRI